MRNTSLWRGFVLPRLSAYPFEVIRLDAATVLLQWAVGSLFFLWVTTRHREVGLGYGWLMRGLAALFGIGSLLVATRYRSVPARDIAAVVFVVVVVGALLVSIQRRKAGVSGKEREHDRRSQEVAAMTGIERAGLDDGTEIAKDAATGGATGPEFPPVLDLIGAAVGVVGLVAAGAAAASGGFGPTALSIARVVAGAAFLGAISDAMLLGHWYLVQPGLPRRLLSELVRLLVVVWPIEVALLLVPTGMVSVFTGRINDGWKGMLGWMWIACAVTTLGLCFVARAALKERQYSAVMAATGLLYLAILTAFGTDLVARAVLSGA
jgi:hypothetical protein